MHTQLSKPQRSLDVSCHVGLKGFYKIEAKQPDGTVRMLADWFDNLITDIGLNRLGTGPIVSACRVGTGTAQPAVTDTDLQAPLASTSTVSAANTAQSTAPYYTTVTWTCTFAQGAVVGNISEVGVGWATSGSTLWSRARIKDGGGVDTTITVTAIEQLTVSYQLRWVVPTADVTGSTTIGGVATNWTLRAGTATNGVWGREGVNGSWFYQTGVLGSSPMGRCWMYDGAISAVTAAPSGSQSAAVSITTNTYTNNSLYKDAIANFPIGAITATSSTRSAYFDSTHGAWQIEFTPPIAKDNTKTLALTFRLSWGRT
jgi:hypothetical protein